MLIEEALESIGASTPRDTSREIVANHAIDPETIEDVDSLDAIIDTIYIAIGELHKLGLSPEQMVESLQVVHNCNVAKTGQKDSEGKVIKDKDSFIPPEPALQEILSRRKIK